MRDSVRIPVLAADDFRVTANGRIRVIGLQPGSLTTRGCILWRRFGKAP